MMTTQYLNSEDKDISNSVYIDYHKLVKNGTIDLSKLTALFLVIGTSDEREAIKAFNAIMYQFALYMQCDGTVRFKSNRFRTIATANDELVAMLSSD